MNLTTGYPYFLINSGLPYDYPRLSRSLQTDVVIIGGGISGALTAFYLTEAGIPCVLVDSRSIGLGSTCASTSLLQYELDIPLSELSRIIGKQAAERAYILSSEAINTLERIARQLDLKSFQRQNSLFYAAYKKDKSLLRDEFESRRKAGFDVELLDEEQIRARYGFSSPSAILSKQGAMTDAYMMTHALLQFSIKRGLQVFDRTSVNKITYLKKDVELNAGDDFQLKSKYIVNATGYEITEFIAKKIVKLISTYVIASEQLESTAFPAEKTLLWNTAYPYLYLRMTDNRRIIVGGRDEAFYDPQKRDRLIAKKSWQLEQDFKKIIS